MQARREYLGRGFRCIKACTVNLNSEWLTILILYYTDSAVEILGCLRKKKKNVLMASFSEMLCAPTICSVPGLKQLSFLSSDLSSV